MKALLLLISLSFGQIAVAQRHSSDKAYLETRWKRTKTNGIVWALTGAFCETIAIPMYTRAVRERNDNFVKSGMRAKNASLEEVVGVVGIYGGASAILGGTTMILIGESKPRKLKQFSLQTGPKSVYLVYRF